MRIKRHLACPPWVQALAGDCSNHCCCRLACVYSFTGESAKFLQYHIFSYWSLIGIEFLHPLRYPLCPQPNSNWNMRPLSTTLITTAIAGVATHNLLFRYGEWHMQAPFIFYLYVSLALLLTAFQIWVQGLLKGLITSTATISTYAISLFASIAVYRVCFHRLKRFPGPFWASISKFWHVFKCIKSSSRNHLVLDGLHHKYGDFVRTGLSPFQELGHCKLMEN
jgi:hypothetical protein